MPTEYRDFSDFPNRGLPLPSWPDLSRLMEAAGGGPITDPTITRVMPPLFLQGSTYNMVIEGTDLSAGSTISFSGTGITVNSYVSRSATRLVANVTIARRALATARLLTITNPDLSTDSVYIKIRKRD